VDITQLIADDHVEQRRFFALIDELESDNRETLRAVWARLRVLLDTHAFSRGAVVLSRIAQARTGRG
jgi:hypothetical protein